MKISNSGSGKPANVKGASTQKVEDKMRKSNVKGGDAKGVADSSRVAVSDRAQQMQKAKEIASQPDSIDEAKVARLQKMIDDGSYKVNSEAVADRLVDSHLLFPD